MLAVTFLERKLGDEREAWDMIVEKARAWLVTKGIDDGEKAKQWWDSAVQTVDGAGKA